MENSTAVTRREAIGRLGALGAAAVVAASPRRVAAQATRAPIKLTFWTWENPQQRPWIQKRITQYMEQHPNVKVDFQWFTFTDLGNVFGKGMDDSVQKIPENGYAFLLEHFGLFAYASFIVFCFSLFFYLRKNSLESRLLMGITQAVPICVLIVMHTSQYPFAFSEYLFIWFVVGTCIYPAVTKDGAPRKAGEKLESARHRT